MVTVAGPLLGAPPLYPAEQEASQLASLEVLSRQLASQTDLHERKG